MYTVMIVEDDRALCTQLAEGLRKWRFNVTIAEDFEHVVAEFGRHQPQLVVMDVNHCLPGCSCCGIMMSSPLNSELSCPRTVVWK